MRDFRRLAFPLALFLSSAAAVRAAPPDGGGPSAGCWVFAALGTDDLGWNHVSSTVGLAASKVDGEDFLRCEYTAIPSPQGPSDFNPIIWSDNGLAIPSGSRYLVVELHLSAFAEAPSVDSSVQPAVLAGEFPERISVMLNWKKYSASDWGRRDFQLRPNLGWQVLAMDLQDVHDDATRPAYLHPMSGPLDGTGTAYDDPWTPSDVNQIRFRLGTNATGGHPQVPGENDYYFLGPGGGTVYRCLIRRILVTDDYAPHVPERHAYAEYIGKHRHTSNGHPDLANRNTHWVRMDEFVDSSDVDASGDERRKLLTWLGENHLAPELKNAAPSLTPRIGYYDDSLRPTSEYHVLLARLAGIEGLFHEWGELGSVIDASLDSMIAAQGSQPMATTTLEPVDVPPTGPDPAAMAALVSGKLGGIAPLFDGREIFNLAQGWYWVHGLDAADIELLQQSYPTDPQVALLRPTGDTPTSPAAADGISEQVDAFAQWSKSNVTFEFDPLAPVFDTYYPATAFSTVRDQLELHVRLNNEENQWRILNGELAVAEDVSGALVPGANPGFDFYGAVFTGFNDTKSHDWNPFDDKRYIAWEDPGGTRLLHSTFDELRDRDRRVAWLMSFNGFKEGHVIEPTRERGFQDVEYLTEQLARWKTSPLADNDPPNASDVRRLRRLLRAPERLYELRGSIEDLTSAVERAGSTLPAELIAATADADAIRDDLLALGAAAKDVAGIESRLDALESSLRLFRAARIVNTRFSFRWEHDNGGGCPPNSFGLDLTATPGGGVPLTTPLALPACEQGLWMQSTVLGKVAEFGVDWSYDLPGYPGVKAGALLSGSQYDATVAFEYLDHVTKDTANQKFDFLRVNAHFDATATDARPLAEERKHVLEDHLATDPTWAEAEIDFRNAAVANPADQYTLQFEANGKLYDGLRYVELDGIGSTFHNLNFQDAAATPPSHAWSIDLGGSENDYVYDVLVNGLDIYVAGEFRDELPFGGCSVVDAGSGDAFVARLDLFGNVVWLARGGGGYLDRAVQLDYDSTAGTVVAHVQTFERPSFDSAINSACGSSGASIVLDDEIEGVPTSLLKEHCFVRVHYAPATGQVLEVNRDLHVNPGTAVDLDPTREYGLSPGEGAQGLGVKRYQALSPDAAYRTGSFREHIALLSAGFTVHRADAIGRSDVMLAKFPDDAANGDGATAEWLLSGGGAWNDWGTAVEVVYDQVSGDAVGLVVTGVFHGQANFGGADLTAPDFDADLGSNAQGFVAAFLLAP